jgi:hypothetical protein
MLAQMLRTGDNRAMADMRRAQMRVDVTMMTDKGEFNVSTWWARTPEFVIQSLKSQLEAAQAVWPELKQYAVTERRLRKKPAANIVRAA